MSKTPDDIKNLEKRIHKAQATYGNKKADETFLSLSNSARRGLIIVIEFVSGVIVGGAIGYTLDMLFGTKPFLLIALLFFGMAAGFLNIYRFVKNEETKET
ncbi:MAG: AtpZ/AtpI family protein [Lactobacillaceae bacterium]|jgi:ATP synthase protein I|nr:AtpZ/AtpI family protein [Lactobacillaceae bacterium]